MKLLARLGERSCEVELLTGDGGVVARVDGREYTLEASEPQPGIHLLKNGGHIFEASVTRQAAGPMSVAVRGHEFEIEVTDPKRLRGSGADAEHGSGRAEIRTAMPGKVVRILKQAGADVEKGDGVIVVEAMKMQNEMKSPKAGVVAEIRAAEGDTVSAGDVLVVID